MPDVSDKAAPATQVREGGKAVIKQYSAVFGRLETPVRKFSVGDVEPYAQHDKSVMIRFTKPRKRNGAYITVVPVPERFAVIEVDGAVVYDSRSDVPIDMDAWAKSAARFGEYAEGELLPPAPGS